MIIAGIDYSLSCPCITVLPKEQCSFEEAKIYYLLDSTKYTGTYKNIEGTLIPSYSSQIERYENLANWTLSKIKGCDIVFIEDYSMGSKGRVFHIAENVGVLKYLLYKNGFNYSTVPPTVIKKFATGKGNADKNKMYEFFKKDQQIDLIKLLDYEKKLGNPITDIIDSFYIAKYGETNVQKEG